MDQGVSIAEIEFSQLDNRNCVHIDVDYVKQLISCGMRVRDLIDVANFINLGELRINRSVVMYMLETMDPALLANKCELHFLIVTASRFGRIDVLDWIYQKGCRWDLSICWNVPNGRRRDAMREWIRSRKLAAQKDLGKGLNSNWYINNNKFINIAT